MIRLTTTAALLTCMATPTIAQVTAPDVWNGLSVLYQSLGLKVDAKQSRSGNTMSISDLKLSADFPFDLGAITISTTGFDLVENTDGSVAMVFPEQLPIAVALTLPDDVFVTMSLAYRLTANNSVATGDPSDFVLTYSADSMSLELTDYFGPVLPITAVDGSYKVTGISGTSRFVSGDMLAFTQESHSSSAAFDGGFTNAETQTTYHQSGVWKELEQALSSTAPTSGITLTDLPAQFRNGLSLQYASTIGSTLGKSRTTKDGQVIGYENATAGTTTASVSLSQNGVSVDATINDYAFNTLIEELPFPLKGALRSLSAAMAIPMLSAPQEQGVAYALSFNDLTLNEEIWAQFDPDGKLPCDPASLKIDLSGTAKLFVDLLDIKAMRKVIDENIKFGEINTVTINNLDISALGGSLTSRGAFTFDNDDTETFDGFPAPTGTATINISGLNAILDQLVDIGLLESDAAFSARMALGLFTVVGEAEDTLVSEIEISPDGQISANGVRLK